MKKKKKLKKNYIRIGLRADKKLKSSFYYYLYDKHFDWAIILGAFFGTLPYIASKIHFFIIIKILLFSFIVYFDIRYITIWKQLQNYYKFFQKAMEKNKSLFTKNEFKELDGEECRKFIINVLDEIKNLGNAYRENKEGLTLKEFIEINPEKAKPLEELLNDDIKLTLKSLIFFETIIHIRGIPKNEQKNYWRILIIIFLVVFFFGVYLIENSFL